MLIRCILIRGLLIRCVLIRDLLITCVLIRGVLIDSEHTDVAHELFISAESLSSECTVIRCYSNGRIVGYVYITLSINSLHGNLPVKHLLFPRIWEVHVLCMYFVTSYSQESDFLQRDLTLDPGSLLAMNVTYCGNCTQVMSIHRHVRNVKCYSCISAEDIILHHVWAVG